MPVLASKDSALGFGKTEEDASKEKVMKALSEFLRPEFIARVDEVIVFNSLKKDDFAKIAEPDVCSEYVPTLTRKSTSNSRLTKPFVSSLQKSHATVQAVLVTSETQFAERLRRKLQTQ